MLSNEEDKSIYKQMVRDYDSENLDMLNDLIRSSKISDSDRNIFNEVFKFNFENIGNHDGYLNVRLGLMTYIHYEWVGNERINHHIELVNTYVLEIHYLNLKDIQKSPGNNRFGRHLYPDFAIVAKKLLKVIEKDFKINVKEFDIPYMKIQLTKKNHKEWIDKELLSSRIQKKIDGIKRYKTSFRTF